MTTKRYEITDEQQYLLDKNPQLEPVSFLDDGDLLVLQKTSPLTAPYEGGSLATYRPYIITLDGRVQGVSYHHEHYHALDDLLESRQAERDVWVTPPTIPAIITPTEAAELLLLVYRIYVKPRTVRNRLLDGTLAGGRLGDSNRPNWYTTCRALDQAVRRGRFPDPIPELPPLADVDEEDPDEPS